MTDALLSGVLLMSPIDVSQAAAPSAATQSAAGQSAPNRSPIMSHAVGTFEVQIIPVPPAPDAPADAHGRMQLSKTFQGGLEGRGLGEMLALRTGSDGAYVAMERVTGTLDGRRGAFSLVHRGIMDAGAQELLITIVPGSGEGELAGISGVFHLTIADGEHRYDLEYSLPEA